MKIDAGNKVLLAKPTTGAKATTPSTPTLANDKVTLSGFKPKPVEVQSEKKEWSFGRIAKTAGVGAGTFVGANVATWVVDLFFHFGNNGGTAFAGPVYLGIAGAAALGAMYLASRK